MTMNLQPAIRRWVGGSMLAMLAVEALVSCGGGGGDSTSSPAGNVMTASLALFAGQPGGQGYADLAGSRARFFGPTSVATDHAGNVYVADSSNNAIRKITASGDVSTLAGSAIAGSSDGSGASASFRSPTGVATDNSGNVYVADAGNNAVRKIAPNGDVTTLAGSTGSVAGSVDGIGTAARFFSPEAVTTDGAGNVYVADTGNCTIRKITPAGVVTTLAGTAGMCGAVDGSGAAARFYNPAGIAADAASDVFVADTNNNTIRQVTPAGVVTTLAGTAGTQGTADGTGPAAQFMNPFGMAVDSAGNVYVADSPNDTIRMITPAGVVTTLAGSAGIAGHVDGARAVASFAQPEGVVVDSAGNVLVADTLNATVRKITPAGVVTTLAGAAASTGHSDGASSSASFNEPSGIAADGAGNIYVSDWANGTIRKVTPAGMVTTLAGTALAGGSADGTGPAASFNRAIGVTADSAGNVYVADTFNGEIRKVTPAGVVTTLRDSTGAALLFSQPWNVAIDGSGNIYVAASGDNTIRKIASNGAVTVFAGSPGVAGSADGAGAAASFFTPKGIATDGAGNVYVADTQNNLIRRISPAGVVTTLAGTGDIRGGFADGTGAAAAFNQPVGVATDAGGNVYVADASNSAIRKITPAGVVTTIVGTPGHPGFNPGKLPGNLNFPMSIAIAGSTMYICDTSENSIAAVSPVP